MPTCEEDRQYTQSRLCEFGIPMQRSQCATAAMVGQQSVHMRSTRREERYLEPEADCLDDVGGEVEEVVTCSWASGGACGDDGGRENWRSDLERSDEVCADGLGRILRQGTGYGGCANYGLFCGDGGCRQVSTWGWFSLWGSAYDDEVNSSDGNRRELLRRLGGRRCRCTRRGWQCQWSVGCIVGEIVVAGADHGVGVGDDYGAEQIGYDHDGELQRRPVSEKSASTSHGKWTRIPYRQWHGLGPGVQELLPRYPLVLHPWQGHEVELSWI